MISPCHPFEQRNGRYPDQGLDFPDTDLSVRLVEWLELLRILGADRVFLYSLAMQGNVSRVVEHYTAAGLVDLVSSNNIRGNL